jgi:hypothetical protein
MRTNHFSTALLLSFALSLNIFALPSDNPYNTIVARNAFNLRAAVQIFEPIPRPSDNVRFTGITLLDGQKKAWFVILPKSVNNSQHYVMLTERQREGMLECLEIDEAANEVKIRNSGIESVLNFKKDGLRPSHGTMSLPKPQAPNHTLNLSTPPPP